MAPRSTPGPVDSLAGWLRRGAGIDTRATAVVETDGHAVSYAELTELSGRVAEWLRERGLGPGDRVGVLLPKSVDAIAAIAGILEAGAAYVPVDPESPAARASLILEDCGVRCLIAGEALLEGAGPGFSGWPDVPVLRLSGTGGGRGLDAALAAAPTDAAPPRAAGPTDLAYILYTSGSTGRPKGVMLSHENALSFLEWCTREFTPRADDRFSSHAPLHFDLSILDVFLPLGHGATLVLLDAAEGRNPQLLAQRIEERRITSWYSAPSILSMLAQFGRLAERDLSALRTILFAGEIFPVKHLRSLAGQVPARVLYNLYGPTETNVCTWFRLPPVIPEDRAEPYPIGRSCDHVVCRVVDADGATVPAGEEGELVVTGAGVMLGYWGRAEENERAFLHDADGTRWYRTGDVVREDEVGDYVFLGRRDRMVKRRGYRIELGEIEAGLYRHAAIRECAVVALPDGESGVRIRAVCAFGDQPRPSIVALKSFSAGVLPLYMVPDEFVLCDALPKTSTDKVDLRRLAEAV